ncbi:unnamed protein product [Phytomonas sp. EM1]|nr:unnamed protein product [Phytomonas sp. EM1]|eukprot:CCW62682.1 unnamed protein product [Phytomonas sp. isolate EM1]
MPSGPAPQNPVGKREQTFVSLNSHEDQLPSINYIRLVAHSMSPEGKVVRNDFAVHKRAARFCRLLDTVLDVADFSTQSKPDLVSGTIPPVTLDQATKEGCEVVLEYLDLVQIRMPTNISKPLRAPLEELVQPWEMAFLLGKCFGDINVEESAEFKTSAFFKTIVKRGPRSLDRILEVAMLSDFLIIESLRNLTCAFLSSLGLSASNEDELLKLCGLDAELSEEDLEPVYAQLGFLRYH